MEKFFETLKKVQEVMLVGLMVVMCLIIFAATVSRFTNLFVISWAEELARYCMIWMIFLGIGVAAVKGEHFCVEVLELFCSRKVLNIIAVINAVIVMVFSIFVSYYGAAILQNQIASGQITPSLRWPMWLMYLSIPLGLIIMAVCYAYRTYVKITGTQKAD